MIMHIYPDPDFPIKKWAEADRPREKFYTFGRQHVSDSELLAIILGSGKKGQSALSLAQYLLSKFNNQLKDLARATPDELARVSGIGKVKSIKILAAMELGNRKWNGNEVEKEQIKSSQQAYTIIRPYFQDLAHEEFWTIFLNRANKVISKQRISAGGLHGTVVDTRMILKQAIERLASSMILCHNHPSGNLRPSQADLEITKKIKSGAEMLDIKVLDHLILGRNDYLSFSDEGFL